jgi:hypothetical protein
MLDSRTKRFRPLCRSKWRFPSGLAAIFVSGFFAPLLLGQSEMARMLDPRLGRLQPTLETSATRYESVDTNRQRVDLGMVDYDMQLLVPLKQSEVSELTMTVGAGALDLASRAQLPNSAEPLPDHLWNIRFGGSYRQYLDEERMFGVLGHIGSPSDKPFDSIEEVEVNLTGMLRIKAEDYNAWILLLNFSNNRDFLPYVPIPGAGYFYQPSREFHALLGAPLTFFNWRFQEKWNLFASYIFPRKLLAELSYAATEKTKLYGRFDWRSRRWFRSKRDDDSDRLNYYEKLVRGGLQFDLTKTFTLDLHAGYAFDRFFYEGDDYDDRDFNRISLTDGPFAGIDASVRF